AVDDEHRRRAGEVQLGELAGPRREVRRQRGRARHPIAAGEDLGVDELGFDELGVAQLGVVGHGVLRPRPSATTPARAVRLRVAPAWPMAPGGAGCAMSARRIDGVSSCAAMPVMLCRSRIVCSVCEMPSAIASIRDDISSGSVWLTAISVTAWILFS